MYVKILNLILMQKSLKNIDDSELIRSVQAGSESSFEELVYRYEKQLFSFLCLRSGNRADAEDLTQRVFVKVYRAIGRFDASRPFAPWVFTIARRETVNFFRARKPELTCEIPPEEVDKADPAVIMAEKENEKGLWELAQSQLNRNQFTVIWLRFQDSLSIREIALRMGKSESHIKVILHRARKNLTKVLRVPPSTKNVDSSILQNSHCAQVQFGTKGE
jgi:RNA polymerase sigma-70 factor (ECF subfamily)